ncbi:MAG: polysaccharide deacetylase family protein [Anaerolineae bacterium]|nr:polysaccharide deacetylase family protein [Anaerolineae bacterium]
MKWFRLLVLLNAAAALLFGAERSLSQAVIDDAVGDGTLRRIRVPVLMYHYVSELPPDADAVRVELTVIPALFTAHMQYLSEQGYNSISFYDLEAALMTGAELPFKPVILTFDDGYIDHYTQVFPTLRSFGLSGTFFIITSRADAGDMGYMNWTQIGEMFTAGMSIESHTKTHQDLRNRDYDFLVYELLGSLESISAHTGHQPQVFSYPVGRYDDAVLSVLAQTDVLRAVTTQHGALHTSDNRLELPRLRVSGGTSVSGLAAILGSK